MHYFLMQDDALINLSLVETKIIPSTKTLEAFKHSLLSPLLVSSVIVMHIHTDKIYQQRGNDQYRQVKHHGPLEPYNLRP